MGETSHKSLRAADMDDVIFAGTNSRPARNNAEVAIHIDNARARRRPQFNEHETLDVSRRIEREKGSTYRINGREVRARDVHILFADASTGSRSPALVHQGRIGEIIQAKPEQRRRVLEEAAGISGLHARRHEAELRLRGGRAQPGAARRRHQPAGRPDRRAQAAGAPGGPLPQRRAAGAQGRGDAVPSALGRRQCRTRRKPSTPSDSSRPRGRRAHRRAGRGLHASGERRRRAAGAARRRSERRRRAAAPGDGARDARRARKRAPSERMAELDRRLVQLAERHRARAARRRRCRGRARAACDRGRGACAGAARRAPSSAAQRRRRASPRPKPRSRPRKRPSAN